MLFFLFVFPGNNKREVYQQKKTRNDRKMTKIQYVPTPV